MKDRLPLATACLHISTVIYAALVMVGLVDLSTQAIDLEMEPGLVLVLILVCVAVIVVLEVVAAGLRRGRFWAWCAAFGIFAIDLPSLFLPLGALGLWGLLSPGTRIKFGVGGDAAQAAAVEDAGSA